MTDITPYPKIFKPGKIGKLRIRNRLVMSPMGGYLTGDYSNVSDRSITYFTERAK